MRHVLRNDKDTELLRSELLSIEQLKRHAMTLAHEHQIDPKLDSDKLLPRLADNTRVLHTAYDVVTKAATAGQTMVPAEAWLLDNFYLIEQQILLAKNHLPRGYSRELPKLANGLSAGYPRVYDLAIELISHMDGRLDSDNASQFIAAYQTVEPLKLGELWAFPIMLQLALLENLRRVAVRIAQRREERDAAITWADRMLAMAEDEPKKLINLLAEFADADVPLTASFVEEFYARLQAQGPAMAFVQTWVEHKLLEQGVTATQLSESSGRVAAANQISIANSFSSLRFIGIMDWKQYVESLSVVEQALREGDPDIYPQQDFATRDRYRHVIEDIARHSSCSELEVAHGCLQLAAQAALAVGADHRKAHIGFYLIDDGRNLLEQSVNCEISWKLKARRIIKRSRLTLYLAPIVILPVVATLLILSWLLQLNVPGWQLGVLALPLLISVSALIIPLINHFITLLLPPRVLPRLDFSQGIPQQHRTMVIVPTLLASTKDVDELIEAIQIRYLGNRDANLFFALLTDFHDAATETLPEDSAIISYATKAIETLNTTYRNEDRPCIFYLFHRPRVWNPYEKIWMGYERKRGKLEQFNARLRGKALNAFSTIVGDTDILPTIQYVITLDTDTQLPRDAAHALIGNLAHPLNRPVFDANVGRIVDGYAILQPRASISLASANQSKFSKLFSGASGIDPYTREVSDVYQDIFGEGSFIGKGIYDVDAFRQVTESRLPENLILSHDLLEGGYARSGLITDVDLIESHPATYTSEASRRHRWIRGDWQLIGWLLPNVLCSNRTDDSLTPWRKNPLSLLSKWKLLDNLRRSLVAPALLAMLVMGWLFTTGIVWFWTVLLLAIILLPTVLFSLIAMVKKPKQSDWFLHLKMTAKSTDHPIMQALTTLIFLPYDALINISAIAQSGVRMLFTKKGLLIWQLPSYARRNKCQTLLNYFREMWIAPLLAIVLTPSLLSIYALNPLVVWLFCLSILVLWLISPVVAWWISQPAVEKTKALTPEQRQFLRISARKTWRYFDDFVNAEDNWLPPDNFQQYPAPLIASRTSPTNMGMSLLADLAAHDFGYLTIRQSIERIDNTLTTMEKLERYRGHFYNWYDTRTLQVLPPYYISSVDSGNLAGSLLTLAAGLAEFKHQPIFSAKTFEGLQDTFQVFVGSLDITTKKSLASEISNLDEILKSSTSQQKDNTIGEMASVLESIKRSSEVIAEMLAADFDPGSRYWIQSYLKQVSALQDSHTNLLAESSLADPIPTLHALAASQNVQALLELNQIDALIHRCHTAAIMDFGFLYDAKAELLTIGFDVTERRRDLSCYDLLASEARLASFLLIAQGQVPQKHWFALGRLLTSHGGDISLISWSGSMFEYLMPQLMMPSYPDTLLDHSCKAAVSRQIQYGRQRSVPWGISESCYNTTDLNQVYQYRAFGVPGLGFKRGLGEDLVIAPYATALALMVMPREACLNLQSLAEQGFSGDFGFYEAIDYTPLRVPRNKSYAIVQAFMAHHQGMSLLSFAHVLLDQPMQRRFLSDPQIRATELLLQERVPKQSATLHPHAAEVSATAKPPIADSRSMMRVFSHNTPIPEAHLLSNGRYHVMATNSGGSYSRWNNLAITRWREDVTADNWGTFIYLRDMDNGEYWSTAYQPTLRKADHYEAIFVQARAEYRRLDLEIEAHTEISVSPEDDVEIRRVTLTNQSDELRRIEVTSYAEVVLAQLTSDLAHRAFSNLFVQTEILADRQAIICTRRPRTAGENVPWMFHLMSAPGADSDAPSFETDRSKFIGRGRTTVNPEVLTNNEHTESATYRLSDTDGPVLDPIVAIRRTLTLSPDISTVVQIISGVAESREAALALVDKYCDRHFVERAFEMAWFHSQEVLRHININEADAQIYGRLANSVIFGNRLRRIAPEIIARNQLGQSRLWRFAISGDLPIVLLSIGDINRIDLVKQALQAHAYWRMKGLIADLVIINEDYSSYRAELQDHIMSLINTGPEAQVLDKPGGVFLRRSDELTEDERVLLQTVARIVFSDIHDTLIEQVDRRVSVTRPSDQLTITAKPTLFPVKSLEPRDGIFKNGLGCFTPDGHEYVIKLEPGTTTPAPWVNVIASPHIGTVVSEGGGSYTWVKNAHEFRLTPWLNDPVSDSSGEAIYIRDEATGEFWSPTPLPARGRTGYVCRHGFGYSVFEHYEAEITSELTTYVAMDAAVKFVVVKLTNQSKRTRNLSLTGYWEWVLGEWRHSNLMHIVTESEPHSGAIFGRNAYSREYANQVAFVHISEQKQSMTGNRTEFIGRNGSLANPAAMAKQHLSGNTGAGFDPCAAIQSKIELAAGQTREVVFIIGSATSVYEANQLINQYGGPVGAKQALESVWEFWNHTLGTINVDTPDPALNVLANGWLVYQTISCRLWGRSGYYQSGGAYGFRDQLQDTMALIHATPWLAREQILLCAGRQFIKGDVQHWWHPPNGQGVRTHFADDYLWLPYATCRYVMTTGDTGILDEQIHFLEGRELSADEEAYYDQPQRSAEIASVYEHCVRALKHGLRFGAHQLPLMGCGDWNDGMNLVGQHGKGESVWLAWFLYDNLRQFSQLAITFNDAEFADKCQQQAELLRYNIEENAWDGEWYQRAWFDDGTPLGSASNDECQIDSISQSWSILSKGGDENRASQAMSAVDKRLVRRDAQLIQLLDPPFDKSDLEPGYIKGYVPGVRENGGQYTHAAIWTTMAFAAMGDKERAWEFYGMLNPVHHGDTAEAIARYKVEPYVMSADIYGSEPHTGRGGWTWYTGAAGWMYRLTVETLLGINLEDGHLRIAPCVPDDWTSFKVHYRYNETLYHITINCQPGQPKQVTRLLLDDLEIDSASEVGANNGKFPVINDQQVHHVVIELNS
ncbi:glycoside hydrolase family 94 protein [Methylophaga muralis]|uniref:N,N'-diacetylchitobiose phosphorylase n=1 Tax=Methylophaga muralis TaxID=291169 RepID=A0A1E3GRD2_9GAMM|nr:glycoside hydrolase family 94 protein [Methylophaga muralis]ODN65971.1 N,N'-diacetylchitobiose phosphorylase [Methylophaga muralis]